MEETNSTELLTGSEMFTLNGTPRGFDVHSFWRFQFSNLSDMQGEVGEFVVSMALNNTLPDNKCGWTQYDIDYNGWRIEVKTTAYYQPWRERSEKYKDKAVSEQRTWSIRKAHEKEFDMTSKLVRNNDVYVFVLITGENAVEANPLQLEHYLFWVIPTYIIDDICDNNKSISLGKVKGIAEDLGFPKGGVGFDNLRSEVDRAIELLKAHRSESLV